MRFASNIVASVAFLCSMKGIFAGFPTENEEEVLGLSTQILTAESDSPQIAADGSFDVIAKYKDAKGRNAILNASRDGHIDVDMSNRGMAAIKVRNVNALIALENNKHIEFVEMDYEVHTLEHIRGAPMSAEEHRRLAEETPWGITRVNLAGIPEDSDGFEPKKICVVDTGYGEGHSDLPTGVPGFSPYGSTQRYNVDGHGHGTHCAGTIGAIGGNDNGVTSVNPNPDDFTFYIGKGLTNSGSGSSSGVAAAIDACGNAGADIISMSLGSSSPSSAIGNAVENWYNEGVLIIAAAGNNGNSGYGWPASFPEVMSVGATSISDNIASFSQFNDQVEISAPGVNVKSTIPSNGYATWSGTSMATPHVAGVAGRVWAHFPTCTNHQIRTVLIRAARDLGASGCDNYFGHGVVDAKAAYDLLDQYGCEAGGVTPDTPADGADGGCGQDIPPLPPLGPPPPTDAPITPAPITPAPVTPAPVTPAPITTAPVTPAPVTPSPVPPSPVTPVPVTPVPITAAPQATPVTEAPVTEAPVTSPSRNCPVGQHELVINVRTDIWSWESRFQIFQGTTRVAYYGFRQQNYEYPPFIRCYPVGRSYRVRLIDTYGDGIIHPGYWQVIWDGEEAYQGPGPTRGAWGLDIDVQE